MNAVDWKIILGYPAVSVFLGTLPLLGAIVWGLIQNDRRLGRIETAQDWMEGKLNDVGERLVRVATNTDNIENRLRQVETRLGNLENKVTEIDNTLVRLETRLEPRIVPSN
jgi:hypothetical protein